MRITKDMVDKGLQKNYFSGKLMAWLGHHEWFARASLGYYRKFVAGQNIDGLQCEERYIKRTKDGTDLRIRIYRPKDASSDPLPAMLYLHGGGYMLGIPEQFPGVFESYIKAQPCIIVAPDYRKSIEAPFPAAFDDGYDTLLWLRDNAASLGAIKDQFIVAGHSAGGGLTAAITLKATDTKDVKIAFQMPAYPMIDDRQNTASNFENNAPIWDAKANKLGWRLYLRGVNPVPPYAAAARAVDYSRLPPTITFIGSIEPFKDETYAYINALKANNIPVKFQEFEGGFHAFEEAVPDAPISKKAKEFFYGAYREFVMKYFFQQS